MSLTDQQVEEYLQRHGLACPHCHSEHLEGGEVEVNSGQVTQGMYCIVCKRVWLDVYTLTDLSVIPRLTRDSEALDSKMEE